MSTTDVGLSFANKEGCTPLDLAFLSLHPEVICMKGPREWIYFDLLHGGGDFGVGGWDRLAGNLVEPNWEKESERVGKSASMLALSVLILNASFLVPFSVLNRMDKWGVDLDQLQGVRAVLFQTFVVFDSIAFACSVMATYFCACAGFAMLDGLTRLKNLMSGTFYVIMAAPALIVAVALALYVVLPSMSFALPIIVAGFGILLRFVYSFFKSKIASIGAHLLAVQARVGFPELARILFQRSAIKPPWVVPSASTRLFWLAAAVFSVYFIPTSVVLVFQQNSSV